MAVTRHTQKDIGSYEAKLIGPLTSKQTIILAPGIAIAVLVGLGLNSLHTLDVVSIFIICGLIITPFGVFAKAKPYGMKLEDFLKAYYKYHYLAPSIRKYKTETFDDVVFAKLGNISDIQPKEKPQNEEALSEKKKNKTKPKEDPDFPSYL